MTANSLSEIDLQVMWSRVIAVVEEQAQVLLRTAFSAIVREAGDLSAGVFDRQGRMLAQAVTGTPGHVNSMAEAVKHVGCTDLNLLSDHICERPRRDVMSEISPVRKGSSRNEMTVDRYVEPVTLAATLTAGARGIHLDYVGTGPASRRGINVPLA